MTETEWLACTDPQPMLEFLQGKASDRKLRLFAVACCRRCIPLIPPDSRDDEGRSWVDLIQHAIEVGERLADGQTVQDEEIPGIGWTCIDGWYAFLSCACPANELLEVSKNVIWGVGQLVYGTKKDSNKEHEASANKSERAAHAQLLREVFGNSFRPLTFAPTWRHLGVVNLAKSIYDERSFGRLPILADALEEAGCINAEILSHLFGPGPHVRGCWALDLILGKE